MNQPDAGEGAADNVGAGADPIEPAVDASADLQTEVGDGGPGGTTTDYHAVDARAENTDAGSGDAVTTIDGSWSDLPNAADTAPDIGGVPLGEGWGLFGSPLTCLDTAENSCAAMPPTFSALGSCVPRWSDIASNVRACPSFIVDRRYDCGAYYLRTLILADGGWFYYYDKLSGDIAAVVAQGNPGVYRCFGGPAQFVQPPMACTQLPSLTVCPSG